ncbi:hypothetical protein O4H61_03245 [Roseovarius aestuarii]|nr:hypothetical protein [Roseovarius aestuarii]
MTMNAGPKLELAATKITHIQSKGCVANFRCGVREIDIWAKDKAWKFHDRGRAKVFVAKQSGQAATLGFYSLSFSLENTNKLSKPEDRDAWRNGAPLLYIDYLAVQTPFQSQKLGQFMLIDALKRSHDVSRSVAFYGVALRSLNDRTTGLYTRFGFNVAPNETNHPLMILPIWSVNDLFNQA